MGVSIVRKRGIKNASNDWICFIDSDDTINENYFSYLAEFIDDEIDFILFERNFKNEKSILNIPKNDLYNYYDNNFLQEYLTHHKFTPFWSKCFNKKFLNKIKINDEKIYEDIIPWLQCIKEVNKFKILPEQLYNYNPNKNSISDSTYKNFYILNILYEALELIDKNQEKLGQFINYIVCILQLLERHILKEHIFNAIMIIFMEIKNEYNHLFQKYLTIKNKNWLWRFLT